MSAIPKIAVTHDEESMDDETNYMTLTDALTDIEDLDDDEKPTTKNQLRSKLKIKLNRDEVLTDLEDFEDSDDEDDKNEKSFVPHSAPINLDDLDLEGGTFEESYKTQVKMPKGKRKLKTQFSCSHINPKEIEYTIFENFTDEEIFDTDNEIIKDSIPEADIDMDIYNTVNINVADKTNKSGLLSPVPRKAMADSAFLSSSPNLSELTDVEVLLSDSDNEKSFKKGKPRRRRYRGGRKPSLTDMEDLDVSDDDIPKFAHYIKPKQSKSKTKAIIKSHSLPYDTDNEDNTHVPFPVCKKIAQKKQNILNIPEFDTNFPTDVEDFDDVSESLPNTKDSKEGDDAFEEKLNEMASCYSNTNEVHSSIKTKNVYKTQSIKSDDTLNDINTDSDVCQTENSDKEFEEVEDIKYDIKFDVVPTAKPLKTKSTLQVIKTDDPITDCENVDSSDEEYSKTIPLALAKRVASLTDEEEFQDDCEDVNNLPEIDLPPAVRNLVILKDNEPFPTIQILPLTEHSPVQSRQESGIIETDEESVSEAEEAVEGTIPTSFSDINLPDCGIINESESTQNKTKILKTPVRDEDNLTDTEEIVLTTRRRKPPKFKHLHERFIAEKNKLSVKNQISKGLTDTEDVLLSDDNSEDFHSLSPLLNLPHETLPLTDTEVVGDASDEEKPYNFCRESSCTPQHMREMSGNLVINKESSGNFSEQDRLSVNKPARLLPNFAVTPSHTDTEDLAASADEEQSYSRAATATPNQFCFDLDPNTKIVSESKRKMNPEGCMYLKGGGFSERLTDIEYFSEDEINFLENKSKTDCKVLVNVVDAPVVYEDGIREWEASKQHPLKLEPSAPALDKKAAQRGTDQPVSFSSIRDAPSASTRPEGEEPAEKDESGYEWNVADQHQLSEEMKELLKELEKETKQ